MKSATSPTMIYSTFISASQGLTAARLPTAHSGHRRLQAYTKATSRPKHTMVATPNNRSGITYLQCVLFALRTQRRIENSLDRAQQRIHRERLHQERIRP